MEDRVGAAAASCSSSQSRRPTELHARRISRGLVGDSCVDRNDTPGLTAIGTAYMQLVDGHPEYSIYLNHEPKDLFGQQGPPRSFQITGFHAAEVEAAQALLMMKGVVPRRPRSTPWRQRPRSLASLLLSIPPDPRGQPVKGKSRTKGGR